MVRRECLTLLPFLAGCARRRANQLRVSTSPPGVSVSGLYLAQELGYFAAAGLDLDLRQISNPAQVAPLLAAGQLEAAFLSLTPGFVNAVAKGADLRIVAGREIASPTCGDAGTLYVNRETLPQATPDLVKLRGKRVTITGRGSVTEFSLDAILGTAGMSSADVQVVPLSQPDAAAALASGKVDAIVVSRFEQNLVALSPNIARWTGLPQIFPNLQYSFVWFGRRLLQADPEIGARFLSIYLRGNREYLDGKTPRYLERLIRESRLDPKRALEACRDNITRDGRVDAESIRRYVEWSVKKGYSPQPVEVSRILDTRFLDRVKFV